MADWNDHIVGDRMTVDQEFSSRVQASRFTSQEWGLIMTATEFEIEEPGSDRARIVANTENLPQIMPELEQVREQMPAGPSPGGDTSPGGGSGLFDSVKSALGIGGGGGVDQERLDAARDLTQEYAEELQRHLESRGKWETVKDIAQRERSE